MFSTSFIASALLFSASYVVAVPTLVARQSITALTTAQVAAYKPYTYFASTAYCSAASTLAWNCGANCQLNPDFLPVASGGDGTSIPWWYVGWSPSLATVIVSHEGTNLTSIESDLIDLNSILGNLDSTLFPGVSTSIKVHSGFAGSHAKVAASILASVKTTISKYSAKKVTLVGHSLGGALALLDSVYLPLYISGVTFNTITYGLPRVGNQAFADYVDANLSLVHINHNKDLVPILPGRYLGYHQPSGEIHISSTNEWDSCPGQDNTSTQCTTGLVSSILVGALSDHMGPYDGFTLGC